MSNKILFVEKLENQCLDDITLFLNENELNFNVPLSNDLVYKNPNFNKSHHDLVIPTNGLPLINVTNNLKLTENFDCVVNFLTNHFKIVRLWFMVYGPGTRLDFHVDSGDNRHVVTLNDDPKFYNYNAMPEKFNKYNEWLKQNTIEEFNNSFLGDDPFNEILNFTSHSVYSFGNTSHTFVNGSNKYRYNFVFETFE